MSSNNSDETKKLVDEHQRLVDVLESPSQEDDKEEAKKQKKELVEYKQKLKKQAIEKSYQDILNLKDQRDALQKAIVESGCDIGDEKEILKGFDLHLSEEESKFFNFLEIIKELD